MIHDPNNTKLLEQYLDGDLSAEEAGRVESLLQADPALREELEALQLAIEAARHKGLHARVKAVREKMLANETAARKPAPVYTLIRKTMRFAAGLLIIAGAFAVYKYFSVTTTSVYNDLYLSYEPGRTRGTVTDPVENAFFQKQWNEVIAQSDQNPGNNKNLFLAGVAQLESGKPAEAISRFEKIITLNAASGSDYFNDEAEFYLALSLVRNGQASEAAALFSAIRKTPGHLYREKAAATTGIDWRILQWKDK